MFDPNLCRSAYANLDGALPTIFENIYTIDMLFVLLVSLYVYLVFSIKRIKSNELELK
jgi:hypothetical protein